MNSVTYNSKTKKMDPADKMFRNLTISFLVMPSLFVLFAIWNLYNNYKETLTYCAIVLALYLIWGFLTLRSLF